MELGIILRHDPLTLGSGYDKKKELRGAFVQSSSRTVRGERKNELRLRSSRHPTKVRQPWGRSDQIRWKWDRVILFFFLQFFIYQIKALICACISQKKSAKTVQNCQSYACTKIQGCDVTVMMGFQMRKSINNSSNGPVNASFLWASTWSICSYKPCDPNALFIISIGWEMTELWLSYHLHRPLKA